MNDPSDDDQETLQQIVADYFEALDLGTAIDRDELIGRHPDLADDLREFFAAHDKMEQVAGAGDTPTVQYDAKLPVKRTAPDLDATMPPAGDLTAGAQGSPLESDSRDAVWYFGDYELLDEIARGGMGVVYKARQVNLDRTVALKMILSGQLASEADVRRFHQEAESAANLHHPGIVPIYEIGQHRGQHFFSMAFVDGPSLAEILTDGPLPPREAAQVAQQIAEAIAYAHSRGVIHRDLKPANVLLAQLDGRMTSGSKSAITISATAEHPGRAGLYEARVTDFGLAKRTEGASELTGTGQIMGTPSYMPPEQASGRIKDIGTAADVYSLGAILYCLLTGHPPFQAATPMDTLMQVLRNEPPTPRQLNPQTPKDLETICLKCLQKEPPKRYESAQELADELGRFLRGEPILARPIGFVERTWRWCRRNPKVASLTVLVALSLIAGTVVSSYYAVQASKHARETLQLADQKTTLANEKASLAEQEQIARQRAEHEQQRAEQAAEHARQAQRKTARHLYVAQMNLVQRAAGESNITRALQLLEAQRPERTGGEDLRGFEWYYWWNVCHDELLTIDTQGRIDDLVCSPDGKVLASAGSGLKLWDAETGQLLRTFTENSLKAVAFSPDGRLLAAGGQDKVLRIWEVQSGELLHALEGHQYRIEALAFHPDGQQIATGGGDDHHGEFHRWDVPSGKPLPSNVNAPSCVFTLAYSPDGKVLAVGRKGGRTNVWDWQTGNKLADWPGGYGAVTSLAFSPDGKRLACGGWNEEIRVCTAITGEDAVVVKGSRGHTEDMRFHPDGVRLATCGSDQRVRVWDSISGKLVREFSGHRGWVTSVNFRSGSGQLVSTGREDHLIKVWDPDSERTGVILKERHGLARLMYSHDNQWMATVDREGAVQLWHAATRQPGPRIEHETRVLDLAFSHSSRQVFTASADGKIVLWDIESAAPLKTFAEHKSLWKSLAISPDGHYLAAGAEDNAVVIWKLQTGKTISSLKGSGGGVVRDVVFSPDSRYLAAADERGSKVWNVATGDEVLNVGQRTSGLAFSADSRLLATTADQAVVLYEVKTGERLLHIAAHTGTVSDVAFSPDGRRLATCSWDHSAKLWDLETGEEVLSFNSGMQLWTLAFSPDGQRLAAASSNAAAVAIWKSRRQKRQSAPARGR